MKKIFLFILLLVSSVSFSQGQRGGNGNSGGRQLQNQNRQGGERKSREPKKFKASDAAGIFFYDINQVLKKIKVKEGGVKQEVTKTLRNYNFKIKEIAFFNSEKFNELNIFMKSMRGNHKRQLNRNNNSNDNQSIDNNRNKNADDPRQKVSKVIRPIRNEIRDNEEELNNLLEKVLSEKQNKKWIKYQKKIKKSLEPVKPDRQNLQRFNSNRQSRQIRMQ